MKIDRFYVSRTFPEKEIDKCWSSGQTIMNVSRGNGEWVVVAATNSYLDNQQWNTNGDFPADVINEGWQNGKDISFLGYGDGRWIVVMSSQTGYTDQQWRTGSRFPEKEISRLSAQGYRVTHLAYGNSLWVVVLAKDTGYSSQTCGVYASFPKDVITNGWNEGYDITALASANGNWALVMSKTSGLSMQQWITQGEFPASDLNSRIKDGYSITALTYGSSIWAAVLSIIDSAEDETEGTDETDDEEDDEEATADTGDLIVNNPQADKLTEQGVQFMNREKYDKAISQFNKAIELQPNHVDALAGIATAYTWLDDFETALKYYEKAFDLDRSIPMLTSNLIVTYNTTENWDKIIEVVNKATPGTIDAIELAETHNAIGVAYYNKGEYKKAIKSYRKAAKIDPDNEVIKENLADAEERKNQLPTVPETNNQAPLITTVPEVDDHELLETSLRELNDMIGLEHIKSDVDDLMKFLSIEKLRKERGLTSNPVALHSVFSGPPGTGKTTVARLLGNIFKAMGLLKKGHVVEVDRSKLVAEFIGQTAVKTNKLIDSALDGILFIDEAYTLAPEDDSRDFGREAVETLLKRMEDDRGRLIVIVAGYTAEMKRFIEANPGLRSRFTRYFFFDDFKPEELTEIFKQTTITHEFRIDPDALAKLQRYTEFIYHARLKSFGNARDMRNLFEEVVRFQGSRLAKSGTTISDEQLVTITEADLTEAIKDEFADDKQETLEDVLKELNGMTGLANVKKDIQTLVNYITIEKLRREKGMTTNPLSLHTVFFGPPGTGKTTVARLLGRIFKAMGLISRGHVVEVARADLVAPYVGQTAPRTMKVIDSALHGILFVDEAYTLTPANGSNDFGQEALDTMLKRMEDDRDKLIVVAAGYTDEMNHFLESNPGLKSRFNRYFYFNDYTPAELTDIFINMCTGRHFTISPAISAMVNDYMEDACNSKDKSFGNGRMVRNFFEKLVQAHSDRVSAISNPDDTALTTFTEEDISNVIGTNTNSSVNSGSKPIGFR